MTGQAAYTKKVQVSADASTWVDVPCTSPSLDLGGEVLDDTVLTGNAGYRSKILGLFDWSIQCDSNYVASNAALGVIRTALIARSALYARYLPDGTTGNGFQGSVVCESFNQSGDIGGLETVSISLSGNGALAAAS